MLPLNYSPKKICILRLSALGDVTHVIPVVNAIHEKWPNCEITWVCGSFEYKLLKIIKNVRFVTFNKKNGVKEYLNLWRNLRTDKFDVLLHMQVAARANIASLAIKAEIKLGWDKFRSRDLHSMFINQKIPVATEQHQLEGFLSFSNAIGATVNTPSWDIPVTQNANEFAEKYIDMGKQLLVISACSSHKLRNWTAERYAQLADYAIDKYNMQVVLSGGPSEVEVNMAETIVSLVKNPVLNLVGKDTLEQLVGLLSKATVVVSPDSGPAHLANAVGVPVIGLYACTWSKRSGPYNSLEYCVDKFEIAAKKYLNTTANSLRWGTKIEQEGVMELIEVQDVCDKLDMVLTR